MTMTYSKCRATVLFLIVLISLEALNSPDNLIDASDRYSKFFGEINGTFTNQIPIIDFLISICFERWNIVHWFCRESLILAQ